MKNFCNIYKKNVLIMLFTIFLLEGASTTIYTQVVINLPEEGIELPDGYETITYMYNFGKHNLEEARNQIWSKVRGDFPLGMKMTGNGLFIGIPKLLSDTELGTTKDSRAAWEKVKGIEKRGERDFAFKLKLSGDKMVEIAPGTIGWKPFSKEFQVRLTVKKPPKWNEVEKLGLMVGLEQSGASSAVPIQRLIFSLYGSSPLPAAIDKRSGSQLGHRLQIWGKINLTSLPQQINNPLIKAPEAFETKIKELKINEITQAVEFLAGLDIRLFHLRANRSWYTLNIIGAFGATTPTVPENSAQIFKLPDSPNAKVIEQLKSKYGNDLDLDGKKYISFIRPDRSKFYRQWFIGLRFKSYKKPQPIESNKNGVTFIREFKSQFPTVCEVSLGRNDFIIDRQLMLEEYDKAMKSQNVANLKKEKNWLVLRIGAFLPIKVKDVTLYLFGTAMLQFKRNKTPLLNEPIILERAQKTIYPDNETVQITLANEYRDFYRIGIGVDLLSFIEKIF